MIRLIFAIGIVITQAGVGICDYVKGDYKTSFIAILLAIINYLVFFTK